MSDKIRVLHMTPPDAKNGVYKYIFNHMQYMDHNKFEFGFLTRAAHELEQSDEYSKLRFHIHPFVSTQRDNPRGLEKETRNVLKNYDIIHLHTSSWRGFMIEELAMELGMKKVIVHSHSTGIDVSDQAERQKQLQEHIKYRERFSEKYATDFWACSHEAGDWLFGNSIPKEKIKYLPNAIHTKKYMFDEAIRNKVRNDLGIESNFVIGNVGRYTYQKNQDFLIRCVAKIKEKYPNIILLCIGQGEMLDAYKRLIGDMDLCENIKLLGWQNNIQNYLQAMDVFCLPSLFEGFPISAIEAQASGLPSMLSTRITDDVRITDLIDYYDLNLDIWVAEIEKRINEFYNPGERCGYDTKVAEKGYDLRYSAQLLESMYLQ